MNKVKYGLLIICLIGGIGYFLTALNVNIRIPDVYNLSMKFNLGSVFSLIERTDSTNFGRNYTSETLHEIVELLNELHLNNLVMGLIVSMVFYLLVIFILIALFVLILTEKFNRGIIVINAIGVVFYIYIAFQLFRLPSAITEALNKNLGFFAGFIDLSKAISIYPGFGFWLTFIAIICLLATNLFLYKNR